jgi:hypothetical protein
VSGDKKCKGVEHITIHGALPKRVERSDGVGELTWEDMKITWAVYPPREVQKSAAEKPMLVRPIRIKCVFTHDDDEEYEAMGEHFMDAIAFARIAKEDWPAKCVELAKATVKSAIESQRMN